MIEQTFIVTYKIKKESFLSYLKIERHDDRAPVIKYAHKDPINFAYVRNADGREMVMSWLYNGTLSAREVSVKNH